MTCGHCVASVTEEVQEIPGVERVAVVLEPVPSPSPAAVR
ncbi:cation transporter [Nocardioides sp. InS609-2]|nr:cation transporter [Nocardioides sp. InS609-2]